MNYSFKKAISHYLQASLGQRVNQHIVVFESDDWGGIRMPSTAAYKKLLKAGLRIGNDPFNKFDSIASIEDLSALFNVLSKFKDSNGNHPIFTFNVTTANPDFAAIKSSDFTEYHFEPFYKTIENKQPGALELWKEGIEKKLVLPQYHGREHVHIYRWLSALRANEDYAIKAFKEDVSGITPPHLKAEYLMAAYDYSENEHTDYQRESIIDGLQIFEQFFNFTPLSFVPPCYISNHSLLHTLNEKGVIALQGKIIQLIPYTGKKEERTYKKELRFSGYYPSKLKINTVRNVFFEPSQNLQFDWISDALKRIEIAFKFRKAAVIDTHRLNYIGSIFEENRVNGLEMLEKLLSRIISIWPDVVFMSSQELANTYKEPGIK